MAENKLRLLLVEDNEDDSVLLLRALAKAEIEVDVLRVETREELVAALEKDGWDAVISDYSLPRFSGPQALSLVRELRPELPFIVVSGAVGEDVAAELMREGAGDYVNKENLARVAPALLREVREAEVHRQAQLAASQTANLEAQLRQAQKLEALGALTAGVAHDFNNMIGAIQIYVDLALMKFHKGNSPEYELKQILAASDRAAGMARQLLLFSRKQPLEQIVFNLGRTVDEILKMLRRLIGERIEVVVEIEEGLPTILGDPGSVEQVIMNLAVNARDAMPGGGTLTLDLRRVVVDEAYCSRNVGAKPGEYVRMSIRDTGFGMDAETADRIFEPFFTTKPSGKGTGLGLAVVYGIVRHHNGWITVESTPGGGTTFEIHMPAAGEGECAAASAETERSTLHGGGERILFVEDEPGYRDVVAEALRASGYEVIVATGVAEATALAGDFEEFLLFSDVQLGDGTGLALAEALLKRKPGLRVLLSSGYTDDASLLPQIRALGIAFIPKPFTFPTLLEALRCLLEGGADPGPADGA